MLSSGRGYKPPVRPLIIGDVHGCSSQLPDLLDKAAPSAGDEIISPGTPSTVDGALSLQPAALLPEKGRQGLAALRDRSDATK